MAEDCLFCKIAANEIKGDIVFEDDNLIAFNDIDPKAPLHVLVIPKKHISRISDIDNDDFILIGQLINCANIIAKEKGYNENGYRLVINCNEDGGQSVYHIHLHLLAGRQMSWPPG